MSQLDVSAIKQLFEQKTTEELFDILTFSQDDYTPEAISLLDAVLMERGIPGDEIITINSIYNHRQNSIAASSVNVVIKAGPWTRVFQFIIDAIILRGLWYTWFALYPAITQDGAYGTSLMITMTYFIITEGLFSRTPAMALFGIKIVRKKDNSKINIGIALLRSMGRIVCSLTFGIGYAVMNKDNNHYMIKWLIPLSLYLK